MKKWDLFQELQCSPDAKAQIQGFIDATQGEDGLRDDIASFYVFGAIGPLVPEFLKRYLI